MLTVAEFTAIFPELVLDSAAANAILPVRGPPLVAVAELKVMVLVPLFVTAALTLIPELELKVKGLLTPTVMGLAIVMLALGAVAVPVPAKESTMTGPVARRSKRPV